jgi:hypothetical protein
MLDVGLEDNIPASAHESYQGMVGLSKERVYANE